MKKSLFISLLMVMVASIGACTYAKGIVPSNKTISRTEKFTRFDELKVSAPVEVTYTQVDGNEYSAVITGPDNIVPLVDARVVDGELRIRFSGATKVDGKPNVKVVVTAPYLEDVDMAAASSFKSAAIDSRELSVELSGASSFCVDKVKASELNIEASGASTASVGMVKAVEVDVELSGASSATIAGTAQNVKYEVSGASTVDAKALKGDYGKVEASGASKVTASINRVTSQKSTGASTVNISR